MRLSGRGAVHPEHIVEVDLAACLFFELSSGGVGPCFSGLDLPSGVRPTAVVAAANKQNSPLSVEGDDA